MNKNPSKPLAAIDIDTPPAQDSPKNILNILNNDCLQAIFRKVDNMRDIYSVAHVCVRFQQNAIECSTFREVEFRWRKVSVNQNNDHGTVFEGKMDEVDMKRFLELFGSRIKSLNCNSINEVTRYKDNRPFRDNSFDLILLDHCRKTLNDLKLKGRACFDVPLPFQSLKTLSMKRVSFSNIDPMYVFPELRSLSVTNSSDMDWSLKQFPKLEHVDLNNDHLTIEFVKHNPQLKSVQFYGARSEWIDAAECFPNTIELIGAIYCDENNIVRLSELQNLRKLSIFGFNVSLKTVKTLFSRFVENNHQIEDLYLELVDKEHVEILQKLKFIKRLHIRYTTENNIFIIAKHLPNLEYLKTNKYPSNENYFNNDYEMCNKVLSGMTEISERCDKLKEIYFGEYFGFGSSFYRFYSSLMELAKRNRVKINIACCFKRILSNTEKTFLRQIIQSKNEWVYVDLTQYLKNEVMNLG